MIKNGFEENFLVKYSEMDSNLALKPFTLLNFLQDIASDNAESLGFGYSDLYPKNYAWFLIKYRMEFEKYPVDLKELKFITQPRGYNKIFAYRNFEIYGSKELLGKVSSMWSLVDITSKSTVALASFFQNNPYMLQFQKNEDDLSFDKILPCSNPFCQKEFIVRYNDLDVNQHANNGNYIVWAFEALDIEFKLNHKIKILDMQYKKEAKYGEKIISLLEFKNENTTLHTLKNSQNEDLCLIKCIWE